MLKPFSEADDGRLVQADRLRQNHPAWIAFLRFCAELKHGEIERLSIQDGLPVIAEVTKKKIKFTG